MTWRPTGGGTSAISVIALIAGLLGFALGGAAFARTKRAAWHGMTTRTTGVHPVYSW